MKRQTRGSAYDISIHRDVVEQNRRQLENRLKSNISTIPAPPLASDDGDGDGEEDYYHYHQSSSSVEYPRHDSGPMPYPDFPSFAHRSREHHFQEEDSHMHMGWSYRTADDDDGINPYGGETMSTAAHHASAVTITAGLGGGRGGHRRDISMSGAEYDPERPLNQIMAGVGRMSMLDDPSKSKHVRAIIFFNAWTTALTTGPTDRAGHVRPHCRRQHRRARSHPPVRLRTAQPLNTPYTTHVPCLVIILRHRTRFSSSCQTIRPLTLNPLLAQEASQSPTTLACRPTPPPPPTTGVSARQTQSRERNDALCKQLGEHVNTSPSPTRLQPCSTNSRSAVATCYSLDVDYFEF
jgi:hypothetical protein